HGQGPAESPPSGASPPGRPPAPGGSPGARRPRRDRSLTLLVAADRAGDGHVQQHGALLEPEETAHFGGQVLLEAGTTVRADVLRHRVEILAGVEGERVPGRDLRARQTVADGADPGGESECSSAWTRRSGRSTGRRIRSAPPSGSMYRARDHSRAVAQLATASRSYSRIACDHW